MARRKWHELRGCVHFVSKVVARWDHGLSVEAAVTLDLRIKTEDLDIEVVIAAFLNEESASCVHKRMKCMLRVLAYLRCKSIHPCGRYGLHICR